MTHYESPIDELAARLQGVDASLTTSIADIRPRRIAQGRAFDEGQDLPVVLVDSEHSGGWEPGVLEVPEQLVHRGGPRSGGTPDGVTNTDR